MACSGWVISYLVSTTVVYKNIDIAFPSVKSCVNIWDNHCYQLHYSRCTHSHFIGMHNSSYCRVSGIPVMPLFHYFTLFHCFLCTKQICPHSEGRPIYKEGTNELARSSLLQIPSCLIQEIAQWKETHIGVFLFVHIPLNTGYQHHILRNFCFKVSCHTCWSYW